MKIIIRSKNYGSQAIDTDTYIPAYASCQSPLYRIIEHIFTEWFESRTAPGAPMAKDIKGMYLGEGDQPAIYTIKGAIRQGIETLIELAKEDNRTVLDTNDILKMDIEAAFE